MSRVKPIWLALALLLFSAPAVSAQGRQFYGRSWHKKGGYYYRNYYYKSSPSYNSYRYHQVIYYPSKPRYYHYYNPYKGKYWGRYDCVSGGYSKLEEPDQREKLSDVKEEAFPKPGKMPAIPESEDGVPIEKPPAGLPPDESPELSRSVVAQMGPAQGEKKEENPPRQDYSGWVKQEDNSYYSCHYYQPSEDSSYKSHRVYYYPSQPKYVYYYNPYSKKYWGRYDRDAKGYSLLAEQDRSGDLRSIPESAFPKPGEMPPIPESKDKVKIKTPPAPPTGGSLE